MTDKLPYITAGVFGFLALAALLACDCSSFTSWHWHAASWLRLASPLGLAVLALHHGPVAALAGLAGFTFGSWLAGDDIW